ncbi:MAG: FlgD immunoglobulin-like domain containing protein [Candidatus Eisenbacteria bacterium]
MSRLLLLLAVCVLAPFTASAQWEPDARLTFDSSESVTCFNNARSVAASGSIIHVVWHDSRNGTTEVYYKRSTDDGATWGDDTRLTNDGSWSERAAVAVHGSSVHVVWYDGRIGPPRIFYKHSLDGGTTWGPDVCLTPDTGVGYHPSIAVWGDIIHVAWTDMSAGPQIYYARSLDNGITWDPAKNITPASPPAGKNLASIAVADAAVHVTWMDSRSGPQIYYTRSLDSGVTWETDRSITPVPSQFGSVAATGATVHVVYADFRWGDSIPLIYYTRSLDGGSNWETAVPIAESFSSWYPSVAVSDSRVHAVWPDNRNGDLSDIYYRGSTDGGVTWEPEVRLTENLSESREPSVAVSATHVHVVWHDDRDGNWEIYYKRGALGSAGAEEDANALGAEPWLLSAQPNPSAGPVVIRYHMPPATSAVLKIFDPSGALVRQIAQGSQPSGGAREILWDGCDETGRPLPSGVYWTRMQVDGTVRTGRVVLTR